MLADVEGALKNIVVNETISFQDGIKLLGNLLRQNQPAFDKEASNGAMSGDEATIMNSTPKPYQLHSSEIDTENDDKSNLEKLEKVRGARYDTKGYGGLDHSKS